MPEVRLRGGEVDGVRLHYVTAGEGSPVVVFLHGLGGFAESWRHNLPALARHATVFALDLPGSGQSAKPRGDYDLVALARSVHGFINALGLAQVSLVGHSLGAGVALTCALVHPSRVDRLVLLAPLVPGFAYEPSLVYRLVTLPGVGEALGLLGHARLYRALLARCFHVAPAQEEVDFLVRYAYPARTSPEARAAYLATLRHVRRDLVDRAADYRRAIAGLEAPVLLVHGRDDRVVPSAHVASAAEAFPRASLRWVRGCGHFPQIEHAATLNAWMAEFLAGRPAAR